MSNQQQQVFEQLLHQFEHFFESSVNKTRFSVRVYVVKDFHLGLATMSTSGYYILWLLLPKEAPVGQNEMM